MSRAGAGLAGNLGKDLPDAGSSSCATLGCARTWRSRAARTSSAPGFCARAFVRRRIGATSRTWSLGSVVLEWLGHRASTTVPAVRRPQGPERLRGAVDAVGRVKLGGPNGPLPPKLSSLVSNLLRVDPKIRPPRCFNFTRPTTNLPVHVHPGATVTDMCSRPEFDLMRPDKDGCMSMLRLTYDHTRMSRSLFNFHAIDATRRDTRHPLRHRRATPSTRRDAIRVSPLRHRRDTCQRTTSAQRASRRTPSRGARRSRAGVL